VFFIAASLLVLAAPTLSSAQPGGRYLERRAADSVRKLGGAAWWDAKSREYDPEVPGSVVEGVDLSWRDVEGDSLSPLLGLPHLRRLDLSGARVDDGSFLWLGQLANIEFLRLDFAGRGVTDARLRHLERLTKVKRIWLTYTSVTDFGLTSVGKMTSLRELVLGGDGVYGGSITGSGFGDLKGLSELRRLVLRGTHVRGSGIERLRGLGKLEELSLGDSSTSDSDMGSVAMLVGLVSLDLSNTDPRHAGITDAGLKEIARLAGLRDLDLSQNAVGDSGVRTLAALSHLTVLNLYKTKVTDAGLGGLAEIPQIEDLFIGGGPIPDAGLERLEGMKRLKNLACWDAPITDAGLMHLRSLPRLEVLSLGQRLRVTEQGVRDLKRAIPKLKIEWIDRDEGPLILK